MVVSNLSTDLIQLDPVKPGKDFRILAAAFRLDIGTGNELPIQPGDVTSISYWVYQQLDVMPGEITQGVQLTGSGSFVPSQVITPNMLRGSGWTKATRPGLPPGYNETLLIPGSFIITPNTVYQIQVTTTLTSGESFDDWYSITTLAAPWQLGGTVGLG